MSYIINIKCISLLLIFLVVFLSCSKNNDLSSVEELVENQEYRQAITKLEEILAEEPDNKQAKLLKIRASMLLKTMQRSPVKPAADAPGKLDDRQSARNTEQITVSKAPQKGFSIMSLGSGTGSELTEITKKLSTN